jgi:hypothetical protein
VSAGETSALGPKRTPVAAGAVRCWALAMALVLLSLVPSTALASAGGVFGPAAAVNPITNQQYVFWPGANAHLLESDYDGGWQGPVDTTASFGLGTTTSAPAIAVGDDNQQFLFWLGAGGYIEEARLTDQWTCCSEFPGWGTATSAPAVAVNPSDDDQYVFWRGADGYVHEAWYGIGWHCCWDFTNWGPAASAPAVAVGDDNSQFVFWRGADGYVHEAWYGGDWHCCQDFRSWGTVAGAPAVAVDPSNDDQYVFWAGGDGYLHESWYYGRWMAAATMTGWGAAATAPAVAVAQDNQQYVFWGAPGGYIDEAHYAGRWATYTFASWMIATSGDTPPGFWYGTDSWPTPVTGTGPYSEPQIGGSYGGYIGMIGNWAWWLGCPGAFLAWSGANSQQANTNLSSYGLGIGTGVYWFMGGPGVDPDYNGTASEAYSWGQRQAARALSDIAGRQVTYKVVVMDIELPGIQPAPDNGWNSVYTSPCSGQVKTRYIPASVDQAVFDGFSQYLTGHSAYLPGVYSSPAVWRTIFGSGSAASVPNNVYEWTYEPDTTDLSLAPAGWCLNGTSTCAQFFGGVTSSSPQALMWQWSGGGGVSNGIGDFDQIDTNNTG